MTGKAVSSQTAGEPSPGELIDAKIASLDDWRGVTLARMRNLIRQADPDIVEAVKWRKPTNPAGVPVWEHAGIICTGETYKTYVKLTFGKGALLADPTGLFNGSMNGHTMRAIDIRQDVEIDSEAFMALVRAAIGFNIDRKRDRAGCHNRTVVTPRRQILPMMNDRRELGSGTACVNDRV